MICDYLSTTDYSQFKSKKGNRPVIQCRVQELKKSILKSNKLHLHPIILDSKYFIIDGQHRLQAAKELKTPIFYVVDQNSQENDIIIFNTHRTNWSLENYVNYYYQQGNEEFKFFQEILNFSKIHHASFTSVYKTLIILCGVRCALMADRIRSGELVLQNKQIARKFIETTFPVCRKLNLSISYLGSKKSTSLFFKSAYISTLAFCFKVMNKRQYEELLSRIEERISIFTDTNSHLEIFHLFKTAYNFNRKKQESKDFPFDSYRPALEKIRDNQE